MREKRRYLLVESSAELSVQDRRSFEHEFLKELLHNIGEINYYRANPKIMKYVSSKRFVLKCNLARYRETLAALTLLKGIGGKEIGFYTLNASGTIRALEKPKGK